MNVLKFSEFGDTNLMALFQAFWGTSHKCNIGIKENTVFEMNLIACFQIVLSETAAISRNII